MMLFLQRRHCLHTTSYLRGKYTTFVNTKYITFVNQFLKNSYYLLQSNYYQAIIF
ncbi:hypothetical protein SAMN05216357_101137 [Porphyromonadaceae bacterium KH3CP3RA]|nr:hypothetical protein SAMN05216357_101137 [Porphyromonadaceae bacterium KH3CP3RA]